MTENVGGIIQVVVRSVVVAVILALMIFTNPSLDQYELFVQQKINEMARREGKAAEGLAMIFGGLASKMIVSQTTRHDFLLGSVFVTELSEKERLGSIGLFGNFLVVQKPSMDDGRNASSEAK